MVDSVRDEDYRRLFSMPVIENDPSRWVCEYSDGEQQYLDTPRFLDIATTLVVFVDGACVNNGRPEAKGYGVYFGSNSGYNVSNALKPHTQQTSQCAELMACLEALNQVERVA
jgi:hypothetical protein